MREQVRLPDDGGKPRRQAQSKIISTYLAAAVVEHAARKTAVVAGTGSSAAIGELLKAFGMHSIGVTRTRARSRLR